MYGTLQIGDVILPDEHFPKKIVKTVLYDGVKHESNQSVKQTDVEKKVYKVIVI